MFSITTAFAITPDLILVYGRDTYEYYERRLNATDFTIAEDFERRKINAPISEKIQLVTRLVKSGSALKDAMLYCFPYFAETVERASREISALPVNAEIRFYPDRYPMFEIKRSSYGCRVDEDRIYEEAYYALSSGIKRIGISVQPIPPDVTAESLSACTRLRSKFSTSYVGSTDERKHNIALALSRINGTVVNAGETFSFNERVGKRTASQGFLPAKIIMEGKYVEGVGGGVCQASTTIYNAVLLAGLKVREVHRHTLVPTYVEPSFDAMVNGSGCDFRFINDSKYPVFIKAYADSATATVEIYSTPQENSIVRKSLTLEMGERPADEEFIDENREYTQGLAGGERVKVSGGAPRVKSEGYLVYTYADGRREEIKIRSDEYAETTGKVAIAPTD